MECNAAAFAVRETSFNWINLLTAITAVGTLATAVIMLLSNLITKKGHRFELITKLQELRYNDDTRIARVELKKLYDKHKDKIGKWFIRNRTNTIDTYRRNFYSYFRRIKDLLDAGLVKENDLKALVNKSDLSMLLWIDRPIEDQIHETLFEREPELSGEKQSTDIFRFYEYYYWKHYRK